MFIETQPDDHKFNNFSDCFTTVKSQKREIEGKAGQFDGYKRQTTISNRASNIAVAETICVSRREAKT